MSDAREEQLGALRAANIERQDAWKAGGDIGPVGGLYRATELGGEAGEVLNVVKKLEREARGWRGSRATVDDLAQELGDVVICADLLAAEYDIDLWAAVVAKFNATSEKVGLPTRLAAGYAKPSPAAEAGQPGSTVWWTVRRVANGDARRPWYELTAEDQASLSTRPAGESAGVVEAPVSWTVALSETAPTPDDLKRFASVIEHGSQYARRSAAQELRDIAKNYPAYPPSYLAARASQPSAGEVE